MQGPQGQRVYNFLGVTVTIPDQGKWVRVVDKAMPPLSTMPGNENFTPIRLLVNLAVVDYDNENTVLTAFNPPIEFDVNYTSQDLWESARIARSLKLAYWDGNSWVVFTESTNQYTLLPPATGTVANVKISTWVGDPPMSWGR